jgi:hypothetical protein
MGGPVFTQSVDGVDNNVPPKGYGVYGRSNNRLGVGVLAEGTLGIGLLATGGGAFGPGAGTGVDASGGFYGVRAFGHNTGVYGFSGGGNGVFGLSNSQGVFGLSRVGYGVVGESSSESESEYSAGVAGRSPRRYGVAGFSYYYPGVYGGSSSGTSPGVFGYCDNLDEGNAPGVYGESRVSDGVRGKGNTTGVRGHGGYAGVWGISDKGYAVFAQSKSGQGVHAVSETSYAGYFEGTVYVKGTLIKDGGSFKIDHPLDPANKYLSHSFVESPDMKNVYDGVVTLDDKGEAVIELPDWFGALNKDFRYQLTAIGAPGPNLHISEEISSDGVTTTTNYYSNSRSNNNGSSRFKMAGGISGMKVSWQVTGIRKDPWANAHRISVEEDKPAKERGYYTYPELYGQPKEKGISRLLVPEIVRAAAPDK